MSNSKHETIAAASRDAIDRVIQIERWKYVWPRRAHGYGGRPGLEPLWTRATSRRALLAKEREFYMEITTSEHEGVTTWQCKYETDVDGSYCRYTFRTHQPRVFYAMAVAARSEQKTIGTVVTKIRPARSMRL